MRERWEWVIVWFVSMFIWRACGALWESWSRPRYLRCRCWTRSRCCPNRPQALGGFPHRPLQRAGAACLSEPLLPWIPASAHLSPVLYNNGVEHHILSCMKLTKSTDNIQALRPLLSKSMHQIRLNTSKLLNMVWCNYNHLGITRC